MTNTINLTSKPIEIYDLMLLGYPAATARPKFLRPKEKMVHYDDCGRDDFRTDEEVREFIRKSRAWVHGTVLRDLSDGSKNTGEED